jgi:chemotaxis protein methyltransferase CheR
MAAASRAPSLSDGDYQRFSQLMLERCGLHFPPKRRSDLELGVQRTFRDSNCADLDAYYLLLQDPRRGAAEMDRLINTLTINETHFFRNAGLNDALYDHVLPQIIERQRASRTLRLWSAGCASGEEPYSLAIMLRELLPDVDRWSVTLLGTDINTEALGRARAAVYGNWAFREQRAKGYRSRYFQPLSKATPATRAETPSSPDVSASRGQSYALIPRVRNMVQFAHFNLVKDDYPSRETNTEHIDLIMCRNVTIYFTEAITACIIDRFHEALADDGWLVVGHSEYSLTTYRRFQARNFPGAILYQRAPRRPETGSCPSVQLEPRGAEPQVLGLRADVVESEIARPTGLVPDAPRPLAVPPPAPAEATMSQVECAPSHQQKIAQARKLLDTGRSEQARDVLLQQVQDADPSEPDYASACALLGEAYANLGHSRHAEHWCRRALRVDELLLPAYYTLALVLQNQGQFEPAIDAMKKVVYIDRNNILGHFGLANIYYSNGQVSRAVKSLKNAQHLLQMRASEEFVPGPGGVSVASLRKTIVRRLRQWNAQAYDS